MLTTLHLDPMDFARFAVRVDRLAHTLSRSLGPDGIRVNVVAPGSIYTEKVREVFSAEVLELQRNRLPIRTHVGPQDVAQALGFFLSPASDAVSGELLRVSGGLR